MRAGQKHGGGPKPAAQLWITGGKLALHLRVGGEQVEPVPRRDVPQRVVALAGRVKSPNQFRPNAQGDVVGNGGGKVALWDLIAGARRRPLDRLPGKRAVDTLGIGQDATGCRSFRCANATFKGLDRTPRLVDVMWVARQPFQFSAIALELLCRRLVERLLQF